VFLSNRGSATKVFRLWHLTEALNPSLVELEMLNAEALAY